MIGLALAASIGLAMPQDPPAWRLVFRDEFDRPGLPDPDKWDYEVGLVRNREAQSYQRASLRNSRVEGGRLIIEAHREDVEGGTYTSASLITLGKFAFQFGRVEVKAKLPAARGTWPAVWMLGEDRSIVRWPRCGEIDIMEHVGHLPGRIHGVVHQIREDGEVHWSQGGHVQVDTASEQFHVYALEWEPSGLKWFVDDKEFFAFPYQGPAKWTFDRRMYLLVNLAIGGTWGGQQGIDEKAFPQRFEVEYVRIYQRY